MRGRIDVRAVLADHRIDSGAEAVSLNSIGQVCLGIGCGAHRRLTEAAPDWCGRAEAVREINELFALYYFQCISERTAFLGGGSKGRSQAQRKSENRSRDLELMVFHIFVLQFNDQPES